MTNHEQDNFEELEAAVNAIKSHSTAGPSEGLVTSTVEALQANVRSAIDSPELPHTRREMMFRFAKYGTLGTAASIAIVFAGSVFFSSLTSQSAFAQVIKNVREATSAKYTLVQKIGNQPAMNCVSSFSGGVVRTEVKGQFIYLADSQTKHTLQLLPAQKIAYRSKIDGDALEQPISIADAMKEMTEEDGKLVETIAQDGKTIDIYHVSKLPSFMGAGKIDDDDTFKVWVDRKTQLPTQIKVRTKMGPQKLPFELDFTDFEWNPKFAPGMFDMTDPEGYQILPMQVPGKD